MYPSSPSDTARADLERLLRELYAARAAGELARLSLLFAGDASLRIAGSSDGKPISINAFGGKEINLWLGVLLKTFRIADYQIASMVIEPPRGVVHWTTEIQSRVTGTRKPTELIDLIESDGVRIRSFQEFFFAD